MSPVTARDFILTDVKEVNEIYSKQDTFGIPSLKNVVTNTIVESESKQVLGYGVVKLFAEAFMILDHRISKKLKAAAFKAMMKIAILQSREVGLEQLFVVSNSDPFTQILCNKYTFKRVPGELLMLDLSSEEKNDGQ